MKIRSRSVLLPLILISLFLFSCLTPQKAFEKGNYPAAFRLAVQKIRANKDIEENKAIIIASAAKMVTSEINKNSPLIRSPNTKDWVIVQNRYYNLLEKIGDANKVLDGGISTSYDELCSAKQDIDFQITKFYYNNGQGFLTQAYNQNSKEQARNAYFQFEKSKKSGGHLFFNDLEALINESREMGIVYYISDGSLSLGSGLFLKPLPRDADFEVDCVVSVRHSSINLLESSSKNRKTYQLRIQVDTEEVKDTAGVVTYTPIYDDVKAVVTTETTTITASQSTWINVEDNTGQCSLTSEHFVTKVSNSYDEVKISGDKRALERGIKEKSGKPAFFENHLKGDLEDAVEDVLRKW